MWSGARILLKLKSVISALLAAINPAPNLTSVTVRLSGNVLRAPLGGIKKRQGQKVTKTQRKVHFSHHPH